MAMEKTIALDAMIASLLEEKKYNTLKDVFSTMNAADIAALFEDLPEASLPLLFRLLPKELAADTFVEMEPEQQEMLISGFSDAELRDVVDELYVDDAADIVEEMPANVVSRILQQADPEKRRMIAEMISTERAQVAVAIARPRSHMMKIMLAPIKAQNAALAYREGSFISFVKRHNTKLFATLKANR